MKKKKKFRIKEEFDMYYVTLKLQYKLLFWWVTIKRFPKFCLFDHSFGSKEIECHLVERCAKELLASLENDDYGKECGWKWPR